MKKIYGNILKVVIICAVITFLGMEFTLFFDVVTSKNNSRNNISKEKVTTSSIQERNEMDDIEKLFDMSGELFYAIGEELNLQGLGIVIMFVIGFVIAVVIFIYVLLYLISWILFKKNENKSKVITALVLTGISCIIQIVLIYSLTNSAISSDSIQLPFLIADLSAIISVVFTIIILVLNRSKIKEVYTKKEKLTLS